MKELEMILAAVAQLGEAGKEAFIWWLVIDKGLWFLTIMSFFALILVVSKMVISATGNTACMKQLRDVLGIGSHGYLTDGERDAVITAVIKLKARESK